MIYRYLDILLKGLLAGVMLLVSRLFLLFSIELLVYSY